MKLSSILGLNARAQLFSYPLNTRRGRCIASSKLVTARFLEKNGIPVPQVYKRFKDPREVLGFKWENLPSSFVLKPNRGMGGEGIIVVKAKCQMPNAKNSADKAGGKSRSWVTAQRKRVTVEDLQLHTLDILEGAYSMGDIPDRAFIQEYVGRHKAFRRFAYRGTPDVRVIVFNKVPVMAMLRLPTRESAGRANLHQGAIGVGVDISTGITTYAVWHGEFIKHKPGTEKKLHGLKIPHWNKILELAVRCQEISGLGYLGVDIVLHPEKGAMVLELNDEPGLEIQLANRAGLKKRLERVDDLEVRGGEHGVKLAKALFASNFARKVAPEDEIKVIGVSQEVKLKGKNGARARVVAKVDTGAWRTAIERSLAEKLGLLEPSNILWTKRVRNALGVEERPVVNLTFWLAGRKITTPASVASRKSLKYPVIVGRKNLKGFLVNPIITKEKGGEDEGSFGYHAYGSV